MTSERVIILTKVDKKYNERCFLIDILSGPKHSISNYI